jgi:hypothetical protein
MAAVGDKTIADGGKNLEPDDKWQDWYVQHKALFAAETNFWSSFEGVSLASIAVPARPAATDSGGQAVQGSVNKAVKKRARNTAKKVAKKAGKKIAKKTAKRGGKARKGS